MRHLLPLVFALLLLAPGAASAQSSTATHGIAVFGELKYPPDFKNFEYVNPNAPKGGTVKLDGFGTYDTFNPYIIRGAPEQGIGHVFEPLMVRSEDEMSTLYCLICESAERSPDRTTITFKLRPQARFQDGSPILADDVLWSFETLRSKGHPRYRIGLQAIDKAEKLDDRTVRFTFKNPDDREAPLDIGELPVLSKAYWASRDFEKTTLDPPLGSGPYKLEAFEPGRSSTYVRVKDYWGADLPVRRGTNNFDTIRYDYYRDMGVMFEAFKAGQFDYYVDYTSKDWATGYDTPAVREGLIKKEEIRHEITEGVQGMVYNARRPIFQDPRVRKALAYAFDFEWSNKNLMYGLYKRTKSYFSNSVFASSGLPQGPELALLETYRGRIPDEVFTTPYEPPTYDGSGNIREGIREALKLLKEAGWSFKGKELVNDKTGQPFVFELLNFEPRGERMILPFKNNLERMGITLNLRNVDATQFQNRVRDFDFDMIPKRLPGSFPPGNELRELFGSAAADQRGSYNLFGVKDKVADELIEHIATTHSMDDLIANSRALDRVLLHGYYLIPEYYAGFFHVAYWNKFQRPTIAPKYNLGFDTWWIDPTQESAVAQRKEQIKTQ